MFINRWFVRSPAVRAIYGKPIRTHIISIDCKNFELAKTARGTSEEELWASGRLDYHRIEERLYSVENAPGFSMEPREEPQKN